jgi:hypothetical protein
MTKLTPELKKAILERLRYHGQKPTAVIKWLKEKHDISVSYSTVYNLNLPPKRVEQATSRVRMTRVSPPHDVPENNCICRFSLPPDSAPMAKTGRGIDVMEARTCAFAPRVKCGGDEFSKQQCPLWSGSGKVI